jgi:NAD(P)-dependent dehydrogenase (short-subunit alcohol dehydrogenase family)
MEDLSRTGVRVIMLENNEPNFLLPMNVAFNKANITYSIDIVDVALNIRTNHGEPAVLIKNAGLAHYEMILDKPEAKIRQTFEDNTLSHFLTVK